MISGFDPLIFLAAACCLAIWVVERLLAVRNRIGLARCVVAFRHSQLRDCALRTVELPLAEAIMAHRPAWESGRRRDVLEEEPPLWVVLRERR